MSVNNFSKEGENLAEIHLVKNKYKILERNYRALRGEIDIICRKKKIIVFIEVKRRRSVQFGDGAEAVQFFKIKQIQKVALFYIKQKKIEDVSYRFDVISILGEENPKINHIENAFEAIDSIF